MKHPRSVLYLIGTVILIVGSCRNTQAVPSFSRQTGLACNVCHSNPPELTSFGRTFKLNGYTLTDASGNSTIESKDLKINRYFPISVMLLLADTSVKTDVPGTQNASAEFPQALSLFLAGEFAPHFGGQVQLPIRTSPITSPWTTPTFVTPITPLCIRKTCSMASP